MKKNEAGSLLDQQFFFHKKIVFTGSLQTMSRSQVQFLVRGLNGFVQTTVSKETDILVLGVRRINIFEEQILSKKEKEARKLICKGIDIELMTEEKFLGLASDQLSSLLRNLK